MHALPVELSHSLTNERFVYYVRREGPNYDASTISSCHQVDQPKIRACVKPGVSGTLHTSHTTLTCHPLQGDLARVKEALLRFCGPALRDLRISMSWGGRLLHPILDGSKPRDRLPGHINTEVAARVLNAQTSSTNIRRCKRRRSCKTYKEGVGKLSRMTLTGQST